MSSDIEALELLFKHHLEPTSTSAVGDGSPEDGSIENYDGNSAELQRQYGDDVEVKDPIYDLPTKPNLDFAQRLGPKNVFSLFNSLHKNIAGQLIQIFLDADGIQNFIALCAYVKERINPFLFQFCYSVAIQHRPDTSSVQVPPIAETFPGNFIDAIDFQEIRGVVSFITNPYDKIHIDVTQNYTASDLEDEERLVYFREDIGVNMLQWYWHLVYPTQGPQKVVSKDRRGELFYNMNHQILARYNVERFCNNLARVVPLNNLREPIEEGYYPKVFNSVNNSTFPVSATHQSLCDILHENNYIEIADVECWRDRIYAAIDEGFVTDTAGNRIQLDEIHGINILGNILEGSALSVNTQLYGNLNGMGHILISFAHNSDNNHSKEIGVMGDVTTAMRDPVFYRWHAFIDNICRKHKTLLRPYNETHLGFTGINIDHIETKLIADQGSHPNTLFTFWQKSEIDLASGLDLGKYGKIYASFTHLQHAPFEYAINVYNATRVPKRGACRIFICPKLNEFGKRLTLDEQSLMAIEMDKFIVNLKPGTNTLCRRSDESSVIIPHERTFRPVHSLAQANGTDELECFRCCGYGWPQHLLVPKGKAEGMAFDLFVIISDYPADAVQQTCHSTVCGDTSSLCGLKNKLCLDNRSMGYPFDRRLPSDDLTALAESYGNMNKTDLTIIFENVVVDKN